MIKTIKINDSKYMVTDSQVFFGQNHLGTWDVYDASKELWIASDLDTYNWAEGTAFEYVMQVSA
jgi:hypothetical protein